VDDFLEQTAVRTKKGIYTFLYYIALVLMGVFGVLALISLTNVVGIHPETGKMMFNLPSLIIAVVFGGLAFLLFRAKDECRVEYDYTFTNGTLDISKVMNDRRRRYLCSLETKEVLSCGPASGPAFQKALNEPGVKRHNWFVNREAKLTYFYFQKKGVKHLAVLELNDAMISVIRSKKYLQMGVWHDADGKSSYASLS
jgi:hypothetical protein